jgi:competence protein ComEC
VLLTSLLTLLTPLKPADSITFLDVGQGDGIYLNLAGENILVDAGSSSSKSMGKYTVEPFLKSSRVSSLDRVFVTHADQDHISGVRYLLTESDIEIDRLYLPVQALEDSAYDALKAEAEAAGTKLIYLKQGDVVLPGGDGERGDSERGDSKDGVGKGGGGNEKESESHKASSPAGTDRCRITCLWPTQETSTEDMNNESLVLLLEDGDFTAYLAGDAGQEAEAEIIERYSAGRVTAISGLKTYDNVDSYASALDSIDLLKCGHHGSSTSTSAELLEVLKPRYGVLSYKEGNRYGHPHKEVLDRLEKYDIETLHTARSGAVTFMLTGRRVIVKIYIND